MRPPRSRLSSPQRRRLLRAFAASGVLASLSRNIALAQAAPSYRALVCIYLDGGNDGENTLIRYDGAGYQDYAAVRTPASGINIPQAELLPVQPARGGPPFGFHPACAPLQRLFGIGKLAVVANVGMLVRPSTRAGLESQGAPRPANLFSHSDQILAVESCDHAGITSIGWGGRMADRLGAENPGSVFPPLVSTSGLRVFASGATSVPLTVPESANFALARSGVSGYPFDALREAMLREGLAPDRTNVYEMAAQLYAEEGFAASSVVFPILQNPGSAVAPYFAGLDTSVGRQMKIVAQLIEGRAQTQMRRQVFYVRQKGYDTHGNQARDHGPLLGDLAKAIAAFFDSMAALGLADSVTAFTLSDFGRTFKPAASVGTDHGWGNYAFVVGGAVRGGDFYGTLPVQALNGPDDLGNAGRWIPTTSVEQYGATLARWFGIADGDLPYVFPNIGAFGNTNLGFMA